jgi:hypothetical protein
MTTITSIMAQLKKQSVNHRSLLIQPINCDSAPFHHQFAVTHPFSIIIFAMTHPQPDGVVVIAAAVIA